MQKKAHRRKHDEMKAEEMNLHAQLQKCKEEQDAAQEFMKYAVKYIDEVAKKIGDGLKNQDTMEIRSWNKVVEEKSSLKHIKGYLK